MPVSRNVTAAAVLFITGSFIFATACAGLVGASATRVPTVVPPTPTALPTETALPLHDQVALQSFQLQDQGQQYTISADVPVLAGSQDPRVVKFNSEAKAIIDNEIAQFKQNVGNLTPMPNAYASTFEAHYNVLSPPGNLISIKYTIQTYYAGAAHPGDVSHTLTYDLEAGKDLTLADLFLPNSPYLDTISKYAISQLSTRDIGFQGFELGATASPENYRNWNLTTDGLMITFDEYQVAPYAAGPQTVTIPYNVLSTILQPNGPVAGLTR